MVKLVCGQSWLHCSFQPVFLKPLLPMPSCLTECSTGRQGLHSPGPQTQTTRLSRALHCTHNLRSFALFPTPKGVRRLGSCRSLHSQEHD